MPIYTELFELAESLEGFLSIEAPEIENLRHVAKQLEKTFSGSWLGYHSRVYYDAFELPPAGHYFSSEWGFHGGLRDSTRGTWREYRNDEIVDFIRKKSGNPNLEKYRALSLEAAQKFENVKSSALSKFHASVSHDGDVYLQTLVGEISVARLTTEEMLIDNMSPKGNFYSRDSRAATEGIVVPPHIEELGRCASIKLPFVGCARLQQAILNLANHLKNIEGSNSMQNPTGDRVFIGHGRSSDWRELKDFLGDRLGLDWDEFNRVPIAGKTNVDRLNQMLDQSCIAFLVMTAEDEQVDGQMQARMNVIHEVGLFQGRLGFERAIVLLEEGCEQFSNIDGLGQIRFPKGGISYIFDQIRQTLEREGIVRT